MMYNLYGILQCEKTKSVNECDSYYTIGGAYDTESTTIAHKEKVKPSDDNSPERYVIDHCFVYHIQFAIGENYFAFRSFPDFVTFFSELLVTIRYINETTESKSKFIVWVANLSHEWSFFKNEISKFNITKIFAKNRREPLLIEIDNIIQFRECIGLFGHSLADISKNWCKKYVKLSGDLDYNKIRTFNTPLDETEQAYCRNDVLSLTEMHENAFKAYTRENGVIYIPYTVSGFVRLKLKESIENDEGLTVKRENNEKWSDKSNVQLLKMWNRNLFTTPDDWNLLRTYGFSGGVVGSNIEHVGKELHNIKCADITSDYPFQMLSKPFPCGGIKEGHRAEWLGALEKNLPVFALVHFDKITAKTNHAFISKHKIINDKKNELSFYERHGAPRDMIVNNGKILTGRNIVLIINDVDYSIYRKAYDLENMTVLKCWYFPWGYRRLPEWLTKCIISDYITKSKLKKELGHAAQNNIIYRDSKSRVNTYYGTLSTRPEDIYNTLDGLSLFIPEKEFTFDDLKKNSWLNPYWAFYVTSYARKMLIENIIAFPECVVQYDTDSIYYIDNKQGKALEKSLTDFNKQTIFRNQKRFKNCSDSEFLDDLGTWDFDDVYTRFLCLGAKKYIKEQNGEIMTVIAGLPKSAIPNEIVTKRLQNPFNYYNAFTADKGYIIIQNMFCNKLASAYSDINYTKYCEITDYNGQTVLQPETSYHALIPIDFTLGLAEDYLKLIRQFRKNKPLK